MRLAILLIAACGTNEPPPPEPAAFRAPAPKPSAPAPPAPAANLVTARELFEHPEWIGTSRWVDIYETIYDEEHSSGAPHGGYDVEVPDAGSFALMPGTDAPGLKTLIARKVPIRVYGELRQTVKDLVLVATQFKPIGWPKPEKVASAAEIVRDRTRWADRYVEVEDDYLVGFEASLLGSVVWLDYWHGVVVHCQPPRDGNAMDWKTYRVRVTCFAHTRRRHYGHMGMRQAEIVANDVTFIDPKRGCS